MLEGTLSAIPVEQTRQQRQWSFVAAQLLPKINLEFSVPYLETRGGQNS
jgi:hypothetical protein